MSKFNLSNMLSSVRTFATKRSPEILTGIGIAGMLTTTVLAVKATPKAIKIMDEKKDELEVDKLTVQETIKSTWKCYIPAAVTCVLSTSCLIGASSVNFKRNAALATAYKLSESALLEYKEKVVETLGEKKEKDIRDKVVEERLNKNPVSKNEVFITDRGSTLCYDSISGRYFKSDYDAIRKAENNINKQLLNEGYASLNEFYDELDLSHTEMGEQLGWNIDKGLIELELGSHLTDDGRPCLAIDYNIPPRYKFYNFL